MTASMTAKGLQAGTCAYCERPGVKVAACCAEHPGKLVCADVADCRDFLLAVVRRQEAEFCS